MGLDQIVGIIYIKGAPLTIESYVFICATKQNKRKTTMRKRKERVDADQIGV